MSKIEIPEAIEYLRSRQNNLKFDEDFLAKPELKSAIAQAIGDAALQIGGEYTKLVDDYRAALSKKLEKQPNKDMPFNSHINGAQLLVYEYQLHLNNIS